MNILKIKRALAELVWTGALLFAAVSIFLRPAAAAVGVLRKLGMCYETVIPALFPFLVLSRLLLESRAASALGLLLRPYTRLLGVRSPKAPAAMLCGVLGGFASGAKAVDVLYRAGELTAAEAALLLVCTIGSGPGFVVSSVGALMLGSAGAGWLLLAAQLSASLGCGLIAALLARLRARGTARSWNQPAAACAARAADGGRHGAGNAAHSQHPQRKRQSAAFLAPHPVGFSHTDKEISRTTPAAERETSPANRSPGARPGPEAAPQNAAPSQTGFVPAVRDAVSAIVMLCGYVTLFSFFAAIVVPTGADASVRFWATLPLEVTSACRAACEAASPWRTQLCCAALSVMGASVFLQVRALLAPRIPLAPLALSRLLHLPLALLLFELLTMLFPSALAAGAQWDASPLLAVRMPPDVMLVMFAMAALACGVLPAPRCLRGGRKGV